MFEIGWSELLVIAVVALIVFPTKDLPKLLRTVGQMVGKARRMAGDFQSQFNSALREAERELDLEETREGLKTLNPVTDIKKALDPIRSVGEDLRRSAMASAASRPRNADLARDKAKALQAEASGQSEPADEGGVPPAQPSIAAVEPPVAMPEAAPPPPATVDQHKPGEDTAKGAGA